MLERKGLPIRAAAGLVDFGGVFLIWWLITLILYPSDPTNLDAILSYRDAIYRYYRVKFILPGVMLGGLAVVEILRAQTPGKMIFKIRVASETQAPATMNQLLIRSAIKYGSAVFFILTGITLIRLFEWLSWTALTGAFISACLAFRPTLQAWHDQIAKTAVVGPPGPVMVGGTRLAFLEQQMPGGGVGFSPVMPGQPMPPAGTPWTPPGPSVPPPPAGMAPPPVAAAPPTAQPPMPPPPQA